MTDTLGDLKSAIIRELYNRTDRTTEIAAAINSAIAHYQRQKFWFSEKDTTLSTVNATPTVALPSDFGFVDGVTITYSTYPIRIIRRDIKTMQELIFNSTILVGQPTDYAIYENKLWFWPTPNGVYSVTLYENFLTAAPTLDADSSYWTQVGAAEELIRSRSVADIFCHVLKNQMALTEMSMLAQGGLPFLSNRERIAYDSLINYSVQKISSGRIKPIDF